MSWRLLRQRGPVAALFADRDWAGAPTVVSCSVDSEALVLGSTQPWPWADGPAPIETVRRRSGGGAVLVGPGQVAWVDVFVPAGHARWEADVGRAFWWLGEAWAGALDALGVHGAVVHRGPLVTTPWSGQVYLAGLGPGEVTVDGRKAVGMAQRRTREGALFQCALALSWDPDRMASLLGLGPDAAVDLARAVHPVGAGGAGGAVGAVNADDCAMALLDHFPDGA